MDRKTTDASDGTGDGDTTTGRVAPEAPHDRRTRDAVMQGIIDRLTVEGEGHDHEQLARRLDDDIAAAGFDPMPRPWVDAVVSGAVNGDAYVVSTPAARREGVPTPDHRVASEIID